MKNSSPLAWMRFNAYGVLLAGLAIMGLLDLINPGKADMARLVGDVPPGQSAWVTGFVVSGLLLMWGFVRRDRIAETLGLGVLNLSLAVQALVAYSLLGWTEFTATRLIILGIVGLCSAARVSVLWTREGLTITIPPRSCKR